MALAYGGPPPFAAGNGARDLDHPTELTDTRLQTALLRQFLRWPGICLTNPKLMPHRVTVLKRVHIVLRITHSGSNKLANLDLEGKLIGPWVDEVQLIVARLRIDAVVCLNLERLSFADSNGIALLTELHRSGVQLCGCTPLIAGMLALDQIQKGGDSILSRIPRHTHE